MGTSFSSSVGSSDGRRLSQEQKDVKYLGDRVPFGDAELVHVYRAYQVLEAKPTDERTTFLRDMAVATASEQQAEERSVLFEAVERNILPPGFGNTLYRQCLLRPQDASPYRRSTDGSSNSNSNSNSKSSGSPTADPVTATVANNDEYSRVAKLERFFDGVAKCGRRGNKAALKALIQCCKPQEVPPKTEAQSVSPALSHQANDSASVFIDPYELVDLGYRIGLATAFLKLAAEQDQDMANFLPQTPPQSSHDEALRAFAKSLVDSAVTRRQRDSPGSSSSELSSTQYVNTEDVLEWAEAVAPMFASTLSTFFYMLLFPGRAEPPSRSSFDYPRIPSESAFFMAPHSPLLFSFGCMSVSLGGEFYRLYTSAADGLSFNRLQNSLLGYGGPTLIIVQSGDCIFGAFTASAWKESKDFYGNSDCFLYQLVPSTAVYRPTINNTNFMYCNSYARSKGYDQQAHGIGFGGTVDQPRLFISETFDHCKASNRDLTFENGDLLSDRFDTDRFDIDNLEVWGVGGTDVVLEALGARDRQRDIRAANIRKARKVDKAAFLDDLRSGLIDSKAFAHRQQIRGRDDACVDPDDPNNYLHPGEKTSS